MLPLSAIPGLGPKAIADLKRLGVLSVADLLAHYPLRYQDLSHKVTTAELHAGETVTIDGVIKSIASRITPHRRMTLIEAVLSDDHGSVKVIWFNQRYLMKALHPGSLVRLSGQVTLGPRGLQFTNPTFELQRAGESVHTGRIVPIYPLTGGITQKRIRSAVAWAMKVVPIADWLPEEVKEREDLIDLVEAVQQIHLPDSFKAVEEARKRLQFDELFLYELTHLKSRAELKKLTAPSIPSSIDAVKTFVASLPFELTGAQRKAAWQIMQDMERGEPMNRLLEGDVGSGKTVVAAIAAFNAAQSGFQTAVLAPTEILAEQHDRSFEKLGLNVSLITSSHDGDPLADVVVGTHALLETKIQFRKLGLVVVDEQHRFGVRQRQALQEKEIENVGVPHLLSMTATPIPRTLALTLYGDLDLSVLDELPKGRKPIATRLVKYGKEAEMYKHVRSELDLGRQAFVVCPLIDSSEEVAAKSVTDLFALLTAGELKAYRCVMLHGRMKSEEKDAIMQAFKRGEIDVLVATTVIEVGVDVPNATVMCIEGAERFGLAQMHQLRGRVGRSDKPSFCYLNPSGFVPEKTYERLKALVDCQNGFELAERDLALRGSGELYGTQQSGYPEFKIANIFDAPLISKARNAAADLLKEDGELVEHPAVRARLEEYVHRVHFE